MSAATIIEAVRRPAAGERRSRAGIPNGKLRWLILVLILATATTTLAAEAGESKELAPMISDAAEEGLKFSESNLAVVIAVDENGDYRIFRGKSAKEDAKEVEFPIDTRKIDFMETFTVFKTNPTYIRVGGQLICF